MNALTFNDPSVVGAAVFAGIAVFIRLGLLAKKKNH